jgi:hypothetical protein
MRIRVFIAMLLLAWLVSGSVLYAQNFSTQKDLVFGQVAAGGGYETVVTATNRGTTNYVGTLYLFRGKGQPWNPVVDGSPVSNGRLGITIIAGATRSFRFTGTGPVEAGFAVFAAQTLEQTSFIEGNLTYAVRSGATLVDSVGVLPSTEFYMATIPFDDFSTIALALANGTLNREAHVTLTLFSESNSRVSNENIDFGGGWHDARFLSEHFPGVTLGRGRLEIQTDIPIFGTALTLTGGELSSLPLAPSPRSYSVTTTAFNGSTTTGEASLWAEGLFVKGYLRIKTFNGGAITPETYLVSGQLINGVLRISFYATGVPFLGEEVNINARFNGFSFPYTNSASAPFVVTWLSDNSTSSGTFSMTSLTRMN